MFEQMKGLSPKKKVEYYWEYYGKITLVILAVAAAAVSFLVHQITAKEEAGGVLLINSAVYGQEETKEAEYLEELLVSLDMDPKEYEIAVNRGIYLGDGVNAQSQMTGIQLMTAMIASQSGDVFFTDEAYFG